MTWAGLNGTAPLQTEAQVMLNRFDKVFYLNIFFLAVKASALQVNFRQMKLSSTAVTFVLFTVQQFSLEPKHSQFCHITVTITIWGVFNGSGDITKTA